MPHEDAILDCANVLKTAFLGGIARWEDDEGPRSLGHIQGWILVDLSPKGQGTALHLDAQHLVAVGQRDGVLFGG